MPADGGAASCGGTVECVGDEDNSAIGGVASARMLRSFLAQILHKERIGLHNTPMVEDSLDESQRQVMDMEDVAVLTPPLLLPMSLQNLDPCTATPVPFFGVCPSCADFGTIPAKKKTEKIH